jgi:hypothetical protein
MSPPVSPARRVVRLAVSVALVLLAISVFWSYRVRADQEAAEFAPMRTTPVVLPAGIAIRAEIRNGIAKFASPGDTITAFVSKSIVLHDTLVVPFGAQLKGTLDKISVVRSTANADVHFTILLTDHHATPIQTRPLAVVLPVRSDIQIFGSGLKVILGATIGASIAAAAGDPHFIGDGVVQGALATTPVGDEVPITVTLVRESIICPISSCERR